MKKIGILLICLLSCLCLFGCEKQDNFKYTSYNMEIIYNHEDKKLFANQTVNYVNNTQSVLDYICFHLYPSAFRQGSNQTVISLNEYKTCYYKGSSYGDIFISNVTFNDNNVAEYEICGDDENILKVFFLESLQPQEIIEINIEFEVKLPNINHRFGYGENTINVANFYPIVCVYENGEFLALAEVREFEDGSAIKSIKFFKI